MSLHYLKKVHRKPETEHSVSKASFLIHFRKCPRNTCSHQVLVLQGKVPLQQSTSANDQRFQTVCHLALHEGKCNVCQILKNISQDGKEPICKKQSKD